MDTDQSEHLQIPTEPHRNESAMSLEATACHVEDVNQPCTDPSCGVHTSANTPAISRAVSHSDLPSLMEGREGFGEQSPAGVTVHSESRPEPQVVEEHLEDALEEHGLHTGLGSEASYEDESNTAPAQSPKKPELTDRESVVAQDVDVTPVESSTAADDTPANSLHAPELTLVTTPPQPEHKKRRDEEETGATVNWSFDDPEALHKHVSDGHGANPFAQLRRQAPEQSASFPPVPPLENKGHEQDGHEQSLLNMMVNEVATGEGGRGPFDSPTEQDLTEQDLFGGVQAGEDAQDEEDFFNKVGRQDGILTQTMGVVDSNPGLQRRDTADQRFEEGIPLVQHDEELVVESKKAMDFFGSEPSSPRPDDLFAGVDQIVEGRSPFDGIQRKSTEQALSGLTNSSYSGQGAASSKSTVVITEIEVGNPAPNVIFSEPTPVDEGNFFSQLREQPQPSEPQPAATEPAAQPPREDQVTAKWDAVLTDDEFLDDDEGFLPSDDEGFLSDDEPEPIQAATAPAGSVGIPQERTAGYIPQQLQQSQQQQWLAQPPQQPLSNSFTPQTGTFLGAPAQTLRHTQSAYFPASTQTQPLHSAALGGTHVPPQPEKTLESFVDKKEGYKSPYDLPMDVVTPSLKRKSSNAQQPQPLVTGFTTPPQRTGSIGSIGSMISPPAAVPAQGPPKSKTATAPPSKQQFFEDLPLAPPKLRSQSAMGRHPQMPPPLVRAGSYGSQVPQVGLGSVQGFHAQPSGPAVPVGQSHLQSPQTALPQPSRYSPAPQQMARQVSGSGSTYAPQPSAGTATTRYSPAVPQGRDCSQPPATGNAVLSPPATAAVPTQAQIASPPTMAGKYAPRPVGPVQPMRPMSATYTQPPTPVSQQTPPQAQVPPQQRGYPTQQAMSAATMQPGIPARQYSPEGLRRTSGEHHVLHSSRPGTAGGPAPHMEVPREEEEDNIVDSHHVAPAGAHTSTPPPPRMTSPPVGAAQRQMSPGKYRSMSPGAESFQPPPRAQTGSPGLHFGRPKIAQKPRDPYERPASALAHSTRPDDYAANSSLQSTMPNGQFSPRKEPVQLNFMPPNDVSAQDNLQRWQGAPVFSWSLGGATTMFPIRTQRFSNEGQGPVIRCSPGEVKFRPLNDLLPLSESHQKFPGPMWTGNRSSNKTKKKETIAYIDSRIKGFEKTLIDIYDPVERRSAEEKCMLWKVVRIMIEHDGSVEGTPEIETAARRVLVPEITQAVEGQETTGFVTMAGVSSMQPANAEVVDAGAVSEFRRKLLSGDREAAVWFAADKRLWAHSLLISSTVGKDLWKRVIEEFVKTEVKTLGQGSESLAMLYETLAGNWDESVDELVPPSARMGMPMLSTTQEPGQSLESRLCKWKESLALILSNRSPGDQASILALGRLLACYGWTAAAHICFIFARQSPLGGAGALFGGSEEPTTDFCLLGADHRSKVELGRDLDTIILSEIYELAVSLAPHASTAMPIFPHLQLWKIHHAILLAENGNKTAAQKYCDSVAAAVKAWGKPSPYFDQAFGHVLEDLTKRLQEAPRDSSTENGSKWIPKLTSDAVSSSMWGAFNRFVSGDEKQDGPNTSHVAADGPFGKIPPGISREQSGVDIYGGYPNGGTMYPPRPTNGNSPPATQAGPPSTAANRYAPAGSGRSSFDGPRSNVYDPTRRASSDSHRGLSTNGGVYELNTNPYEPQHTPSILGSSPYDNHRSVSGFTPNPQGRKAPLEAPRGSLEATPEVPEANHTTDSGYMAFSTQTNGYQPPSSAGYEPPKNSGGYEPLGDDFTPYQPEPEEGEKKPKKSILDDDDDDLLKKSEAINKKAEEEKKKSATDQKKGWFGWFGRKNPDEHQGPIKAKLGEENAFVYDPDLKRWVNKKAGAESPVVGKPAPPPKRAPTPSGSAPPGTSTGPPTLPNVPGSSLSAPPPTSVGLTPPMAPPGRGTPSPGPPSRTASSGPPSRPSTAGGDAMDELLGPPGPRKSTPAGGRKRKGGASRYVEVIPGQ